MSLRVTEVVALVAAVVGEPLPLVAVANVGGVYVAGSGEAFSKVELVLRFQETPEGTFINGLLEVVVKLQSLLRTVAITCGIVAGVWLVHGLVEILWGASEVVERIRVNIDVALGTVMVTEWCREKKVSQYIALDGIKESDGLRVVERRGRRTTLGSHWDGGP